MEPEDCTPTPEPPEHLTFPDLVKVLVVDFVGFARRHLTQPGPPLMYIAIWLVGMDAVAGGIELGYTYGQQYEVDNWFFAWIRIVLVGAPTGVFRYWLVGSIFHLVVMAAHGKGPARTSRYILLYALVPAAVTNLSIKVIQMLIYQNGYFAGDRNEFVESVFGLLMMAAYVFTLVLCYRGMRALQHTDRRRSVVILAALSLGTILLTAVILGF
ncbi:MAG: Yip1 family protein [Candidatus Latescibacterota bacterium]|jgi:hypothetical protein